MPATLPTSEFTASSLVVIIEALTSNPEADPIPITQFSMDATKLALMEDEDIAALTEIYTSRAHTAMPQYTIRHTRQWGYGISPQVTDDPVIDYEATTDGGDNGGA